MRLRNLLLIMGILVIALFESKGEGTKQIMPTSGSNGELQLMPSFSQFALFDCPESDRLYIHIKTVGEKYVLDLENDGIIMGVR